MLDLWAFGSSEMIITLASHKISEPAILNAIQNICTSHKQPHVAV